MLYYTAQNHMTSPQAGFCTKLLLRDTSTNEIVCFVICVSDDTYIIGKKGEDNFDKYIKVFKLDDANNSNRSESDTSTNAK